MATERLQERQLALLGPAGHGLGGYVQDVGHLGGPEVAAGFGCGVAGALGCHGASLSCGRTPTLCRSLDGTGVRPTRQQAVRSADANGHPAGCKTSRAMMESTQNDCHSPIGLFQRTCGLVPHGVPLGLSGPSGRTSSRLVISLSGDGGSWHGAGWGRQVPAAALVPAALAAAGHGDAEYQDEQDRGDDKQDSPHGSPPCPCFSSPYIGETRSTRTIAGSSVREGPISSGARGAQLLGHVSRTLGRPPEIPARDPSLGERGLLRDVFQGRRGGAVPGLIADCRWEQRQREREGTALTQGALDPDPPAVLLDDAAANGQTKAAAALVARIGRIDLLEAPENGLQLVGRDAPTLILDANQHLAAPRFGGNPDGGVRR